MYKIYDTQSDKEDKNSLYSSFWSDEEEEKKVETEQAIRGKDIIPVSHTENSLQDGLEEKETEPDNWDNTRQGSDEEEVKIHQVIGNDGCKPPSDAENSLQEGKHEERSESNEEEDESSYSSEGDSDEDEDEEEGEISEEDSKYVADTEDSSQEASEEEEEQDGSSDFNVESEDEEEEEGEVDTGEEDSTPAKEEEDSVQVASEEESQELENQTEGGSDEEEENEISEDDLKTVSEAEDSPKEASEEEKPELMEQEKKNTGSSGSRSDEEEEEEAEHLIRKEDLKLDADEEDFLKVENNDLNIQDNSTRDNFEEPNDEDDDDEEAKSCSSRSDSPAPSMMTSGYGTYRTEEQEGGDYRDDHTITEFDQDSRGDLSEVRDEDDDETLSSFGGFEIETTETDYTQTQPLSVLASPKHGADVEICRDDREVDITGMKTEEDKEKIKRLQASSDHEEKTQEHHYAVDEDKTHFGDRKVDVEAAKEDEEENMDKEVEDRAESDESSSNKDIKFIDSKADLTTMTYNKMFEGWEGNLRHKKDAASCLEEHLTELHLSSPAQHDFETENEDAGSQSDTLSSEAEGVSMSAFESYIRGMTRSRSDGDIRPKPKSFIRPVMNQQTIKKTDPVAKYFQYKQLWEMFKLPGESDRRALRQEIKEQLAYQPPPPKPRRVYVPNTYIVPTEKKRSALRWEIRTDLANGVLPHKFSHRF